MSDSKESNVVRNNYRIYNPNMPKYQEILADKYGSKYKEYRESWDESLKFKNLRDFPMQIDMDTADICNLNCKYCNARNNFPRKITNIKVSNEFVNLLFEEVMKPKGKDSLFALDLGYLGEPLLFKQQVYNILEKCNIAGLLETYIHTNGQLLTLDIFKELVKLNLTHLFISVDTINSSKYRELRGGHLEPVMENVLNLLEYKKKENLVFPLVRVAFMNSPETHSEAEEFINFWKDKVDFIDIQTFCDWNTPITSKTIPMLCPQPWQRMSLGPIGEMNACCAAITDQYSESQRLGIFPDMSIYEAWNSQKAQNLRKGILNRDLSEFPFCEECHIRTYAIDYKEE
jgi:pyruvate-formate lyase-activating enzyme